MRVSVNNPAESRTNAKVKATIAVKKSLEAVLTVEQKKSYYNILKRWLSCASPLTKNEFHTKIREILQTPEQLQKHNKFLYAFLCDSYVLNREESKFFGRRSRGLFEVADSLEYSSTISPSSIPHHIEHRSAAAEMFVPDYNFIRNKIAVYAWENGLDGAEEGVTKLVMNACRVFIQNIITAMLSRKMGYKIRNRHFQHSFGVPVPNPFLRNTNYVRDTTQECKAQVSNDDDSFVPASRPTLEIAEEQTLFSRACARKRRKRDRKLDLKLLYHTLRENPSLVGFNSVYSLHMLKMAATLEDL